MRFKVYLLRERGRTLPWREVVNRPAYVGDLLTHTMVKPRGHYTVATLLSGDGYRVHLVPDLYEPVFRGMATLAFRLRGFERVDTRDGPITVIQEWHCELPGHDDIPTPEKEGQS